MNIGYRDHHVRFAILSQIRSGSTLLAHLLDSHFQIRVTRFEPLHPYVPLWKDIEPNLKLDLLLNETGYRVTGFKAIPIQWKEGDKEGVWRWVQAHNIPLIITTRPNYIRAAASIFLSEATGRWNDIHNVNGVKQLIIEPTVFIKKCRDYKRLNGYWLDKAKETGLPLMHLTYDDILNGIYDKDGITFTKLEFSERLLNFFPVKLHKQHLLSETKRMNKPILPELIGNWNQIETELRKDSDLRWALDTYGVTDG